MKQQTQSGWSQTAVELSRFFSRPVDTVACSKPSPVRWEIYRGVGTVETFICAVRDEEAAKVFRDLLEDHRRTLAFLTRDHGGRSGSMSRDEQM